MSYVAVMPTDVDAERGDRLVIGSDDPYEIVTGPYVATYSAVSRAGVKQEVWDEPIA